MIFLGINKPTSRTIRHASANLRSALTRTLGLRCRPRGGVCEGPPSPAWQQLGPGARGPGARSPARFFPAPRCPSPRPAAPVEPSVLFGDLPGPRRPRSAAQTRGVRRSGTRPGPGGGAVTRPGPSQLGPSRESAWLLSPLKGRSEKGRGLCEDCWGSSVPGGASGSGLRRTD